MFEECYAELMSKPKYAPLRERFTSDVSAVHNGYFSQDKKDRYKDTRGDTLDDYDTYNTIMREKEWLLSFDCPLRFIFSHSALKEGWDNPNVFQVCTLIDQKSAFTCCQKVGRGLRLCVNQDGERIEDFAVALDNDPDVKMFFKIPDRFKIETPIGTYNPDWAVCLTKKRRRKTLFYPRNERQHQLYGFAHP